MIERSYFTNLDGAVAELGCACRAAADIVDGLTPDTRVADAAAARWLANQIEVLCRDVEACGGPAGLSDAGSQLADAMESLTGWPAVHEAQARFDVVESMALAAAVHLPL